MYQVIMALALSMSHDCDIRHMAYDNPLSDHHWYRQPRYAWHAEYMASAWLVGKIPPIPATRFLPVSVKLGLHIRGLERRTYKFNGADWLADSWLMLTPAVGIHAELAGYPFLVACLASP